MSGKRNVTLRDGTRGNARVYRAWHGEALTESP
jgi:hypothetical protein